MNNSQSSGILTMIIVIVLLVAIGVGGYFGYTKWLVPKQCVAQASDKTSNVATFMYDSKKGKCVANVCIDGFGNAATGGLPVKGICTQFMSPSPKYNELQGTGNISGTCGGTSGTAVTAVTTQMGCETACNASTTGCVGYDYNGSTECNTFATPLVPPTTADQNYKCYQKPTTMSMYQMY
jgi:hypothetical protein